MITPYEYEERHRQQRYKWHEGGGKSQYVQRAAGDTHDIGLQSVDTTESAELGDLQDDSVVSLRFGPPVHVHGMLSRRDGSVSWTRIQDEWWKKKQERVILSERNSSREQFDILLMRFLPAVTVLRRRTYRTFDDDCTITKIIYTHGQSAPESTAVSTSANYRLVTTTLMQVRDTSVTHWDMIDDQLLKCKGISRQTDKVMSESGESKLPDK